MTEKESERETRRKRINPKLRALGWKIVPFREGKALSQQDGCAIEEYPTDAGPADYAFCLDGRILAIAEAKKVSLGPQNVLTQAERYSRGVRESFLNFDGFHVPFLYSTNGEVFWFHDVRHPRSRSRKVTAFHTPDALREMFNSNFEEAVDRLNASPNDLPFLRPYQVEANDAVEQAIADRKRQMLVAMATGTGKTFTLVNQIYRLMKSGVAKRVLFLVDRRALAAQAVRAFHSFEPEPGLKFNQIYEVYSQRFRREDVEGESFDPSTLPTAYLAKPQPGMAFVYVCTIQRMAINLFGREAVMGFGDDAGDDDADKIDLPIHAFDIIVADECHRGYTTKEISLWRGTLDHFDAIKIGLTATPAAHTKAYFKEVVFRYTFTQAVQEGHLVDYDMVPVRSEVRMNGVFLKEGESVGIIDTETGHEHLDILEDERDFDATAIESKVTAPDSNRKIIEEIRKYALQHETKYGRFPKTLIFAANDLPHTSHADQLVEICRDTFGQGDSFVQKITGRVDRPLQRIREFRNRPLPGIVVTVDLLTTGVDIPDLEFIVFLRPVKSRILFEQMMGRGTRKGEKFPDKSHFVVFDCFDGTLFEYFRKSTGITAEPPERESLSIPELIQNIWDNRERDYNIRCLVKRFQRIDKEMSGEARDLFSAYIDGGDLGRYARELAKRLHDDFAGTMALLRNPAFQSLLADYPRAKRSFVVAYETEDQVTSRWIMRDDQGNELRPEDYLEAFSHFVKENPAQITAISILLGRPKEWSPEVLSELKVKLAATPERFSLNNLQRAHEVHYHKALVDIISMVKHAAREAEPLYTAEERVHAVLARLCHGKTFTPEQQQWLDRIHDHLVHNLSVSREDFEELPLFTRAGGWKRANEAFQGRLKDFLRSINQEIAA